VNHRRLASAGVISFLALIATSCSTGGTAAPAPSSSAPSTTTPATTLPTTTTVGSATSVGHAQSATDPAGQKVTALAGKPTLGGPGVGGPPGSWVMVLVLTNAGPGTFQSSPPTQVTIVDASGTSHAPVPGSQVVQGKPSSLAPGQQLKMLLYFVMGPTVNPTSVSFSPFGPSVAPLRWAI
jgi:hypothetical protein